MHTKEVYNCIADNGVIIGMGDIFIPLTTCNTKWAHFEHVLDLASAIMEDDTVFPTTKALDIKKLT